jgi:hypothetical protein
VPWWLCRFFCNDIERAAIEAPTLETEERVARFGRPTIVEQFDSLPLEDFQQELECRFVDESYSFYPYDLILPNTREDLTLCDDFSDLPFPEGRLVAGFDVGRSHDRSELAGHDRQHSRGWHGDVHGERHDRDIDAPAVAGQHGHSDGASRVHRHEPLQ